MFTRATKNFGIWREHHNSRRRYAGSPTSGFVMAMGAAALVAWLAFILVWKIRGDFYLIESALVPLPAFSEDTDALFTQRPAAVAVALIASPRATQDITLLFDSGRVFRFPSQEKEIMDYLDERVDMLEYTSMLAMDADPSISRVQIWPDKKIGQGMLSTIMRIFAEKGFDDFDIAMQGGRKS